MERPAYLPAKIVGAPIDCVWEGPQAHIGAVEQVTPRMKRLSRCTGLAQVVQCAGVLQWATWRFDQLADNAHHHELIEAAFAYTVDWRYTDADAGPDVEAPPQPVELSATLKLGDLLRRALNPEEYWNSFWTPISETYHAANIVAHVLPKGSRATFEGWLDAVADRMATHFPLPDLEYRKFRSFPDEAAYDAYVAPRRGIAVPPQLLDPTFDYDPAQHDQLIADFVAGLDPARNRYLRSAAAMAELGFEGAPYPGV
jgi:hypothetical protein